MKKYVFDRNDFKWAEEFYDIIMSTLSLPAWFGKNADALWDMITGYIETPCTFIFRGFHKKENQYNVATINEILSCFTDASKKYPKDFLVIFA